MRWFLIKNVLLQPNFETISRLHINLYIMGRPFSMWTIIGLYTEILSYSRASYICWMENNPDGHLLKVFVFLLLYLESNQVIILWKVSKRNKKDQKPDFSFPLLTLLEFYLHLQIFFVIFSSYRFQMKQISNLEIQYETTSNEFEQFHFLGSSLPENGFRLGNSENKCRNKN